MTGHKHKAVRVYKKQSVYEAALDRIRLLFDEFGTVIVNFSGGKDSTVLLNLALQVAHERGRLPLTVAFIDQEAEWQATVDYMREIMYREDVNPRWYQMPIQLFNATSTTSHWLWCWDPDEEDKWMRPKEPIAIKENVYDETRFHALFNAIMGHEYPDTRVAKLSGTRTEESPSRFFGLTSFATYKWITWGRKEDVKRGHYTFCPLYDWTYSDIWKAIQDNGWSYNRLYDIQYQYGVPIRNMRVSNLHHETAVHFLFYLQEVEPETYQRLTQRLPGVDMAGKMGLSDYFPKKLPWMFRDWKDYRDHLLEKLVDPAHRDGMKKIMDRQERDYGHIHGDKLYKMHVNSILTNDWEGVKLKNFDDSFEQTNIRKANHARE